MAMNNQDLENEKPPQGGFVRYIPPKDSPCEAMLYFIPSLCYY